MEMVIVTDYNNKFKWTVDAI